MKNVAASVRARLLNQARSTGEPFGNVLETFAAGRFLYRLSQSSYRDRFILKGAQLYRVWGVADHRPTRDLDLLGFGESTPAAVKEMFASIIEGPSDPEDGLEWIEVNAGLIREDQSYGGVRANIRAELLGARIPLQIDVGFGDAITPGPVSAEWPSLLEFPSARLLVYPPETVVAEKSEAAVSLGLANSRMKDFYDLHWLASNQSFDGSVLRAAIEATFSRRGTGLPGTDTIAFTDEFATDNGKKTQWIAFKRKVGIESDPSLQELMDSIRSFVNPVFEDAVSNHTWNPQVGLWQGQDK